MSNFRQEMCIVVATGRRRIVLALWALLAAFIAPAAGPAGLDGSLTGTVSLIWGDGAPGRGGSIGPLVILADGAGNSVELILTPATVEAVGGVVGLNGRSVTVTGSWVAAAAARFGMAALAVSELRLADADAPVAPAAVTGSNPWVSIMCKFSDIATEPKNLAYFQGMYASVFPGLDHYWREVSYNTVNVFGSNAHGWFTLPHPRSYYITGSPPTANLSALFTDCTGVADPYVNFAPYTGINMMFNSDLDGYAWGGTRYASLDGVSKVWSVTWEPPWGYGSVSVISHEMGHGFGLPHSTWDNPDPEDAYDNSWDVMSNSWAGSGSDPTYGHFAQHTIAYHKDMLGWFRPPEKVTVPVGGSTSVVLERLALPGFPITKAVRVPIGGSGSHFYTVEARQKTGYDVQVPGAATIIHEVDTARSIDAYVMGTDGGMGAAWTPGELFRDAGNSIGIVVTGSSASGYTVAVANGPSLAASFPAADAHAATGTSSDLNGVLEPGEAVHFESGWTNVTTGSIGGVTGGSAGFTGPAGATYSVPDGAAAFGTIASAATGTCVAQSNCYVLQVSNPPARPATHWDASFTEGVTGGVSRTWTVHIGNSFTDVPASHWAYRFVESLLHSGITAGCSATDFCPGSSLTRWQMAVFLANGLTANSVPVSGTVPGRGSYNCVPGGQSVFADVAPDDVGCRFIHYIAAKEITAGCDATRYCPANVVTRWQVAVFLARAMTGGGELPVSGTVSGLGGFNCVSGGTSVFSDVPPTDAACRHIHFLASQSITAGCGGGAYCPAADLRRDQMAVFISKAFGLRLYHP
jgi:M6 family metalloprotease-like protein